MICYLMRHGDARSELQDPLRPLSDLGHRQVEAVAGAAAARGVKVAAVWHSDKLRARQTAEIAARLLGVPGSAREVPGLGPEDDPALVQAELDSATDGVLLVGHLPHLSRLASLLVSGDPERRRIEIPTAALVCLLREAGSWKVDWVLNPNLSS